MFWHTYISLNYKQSFFLKNRHTFLCARLGIVLVVHLGCEQNPRTFVTLKTEISFLIVLGAGCLRSKCQQGWFFSPGLADVNFFNVSSHVSSLCKDTSQVRLGAILITAFNLKYPLKGHISKHCQYCLNINFREPLFSQ